MNRDVKWDFQKPREDKVQYTPSSSREGEVGWTSVKSNTGITITKEMG